MAQKFKYPLVCVIWDDAESDSLWENVAEHKLEPKLATTVAFLVLENEEHVLLASSYDENATNNRIQIPKGMIKSMKVLRK